MSDRDDLGRTQCSRRFISVAFVLTCENYAVENTREIIPAHRDGYLLFQVCWTQPSNISHIQRTNQKTKPKFGRS